jgi:superfamily II DNA or RNA helicase
VIELRPYQQRAIEDVRRAYRRTKRVLLVAPTGFGKTATASALIQWAVAKGRRVVFTVHRREIVLDTARRLEASGVPCGIVMAGQKPSDLSVQVCSIQTLVAREAAPPADLIVWDEAHHCAAETYREIAAQYPDAWHLGLTATPERADEAGLRDAFDELVIGATVRELQEQGYLAECDVFAPKVVRKDALAMDPLEAWKTYAEGRPTVVFHRNISDSIGFTAELGGICAHIDGSTPTAQRDETLARFARGELQVLSNVFVLTEGWDAPRVKVCMIARGVGSVGMYLQMVGRVLRRHGDERAMLIDLTGAAREHGLPDEDRSFTLDGIGEIKKGNGRETISACVTCGFVTTPAKRGDRCVKCGTLWPVFAPQRHTVVQQQLHRVVPDSMASRAERDEELEQLLRTAAERGYKPGWVGIRFKAKYGYWPRY